MRPSLATKIKKANKVIVEDGKLDQVKDFFTADYVVHVTDKDFSGGHATIQKILRALLRAFTITEVDVEILLEGKDRIAWQRTITATHTGAYKGFPASGRKIIWQDMVVSQFQDGLIKEEWLVTDLAERLLLSRKR